MKFLYFGDLHERSTAPEHRTDDFRLTVNKKIEEIRALGEKHQVRAFLQPGDFLDKPKVDSEFLSEVVKRWGFSEIQEQAFQLATGEKTNADLAKGLSGYRPIVGAIGNHELYGNALRSYPRTSLALLEEMGFMHLPKKDEPIIFNDPSGFSVAITAGHYDTKMDDPSMLDVYLVEKKLADFHIHIVHGYLMNKDMGDLFPHTTVDEIAKRTEADLTISGHDHIGFKPIEVDGKWFVNPGAVIRLSNDKKEIRRKPKVMLIDIDKENGLSLKQIYLKTAEKGEDVLDRTHVAFQKSMNNKMEEIKSLVQKSQVGSGLSITDIIKAISDSKQLDESLKDRAINAVTEKMNTNTKARQQSEDYYIKRIVLENFQSHKHSEFELEDGLNVFIGKSSSGKSAVQRALSWVYENEGANPRRFIKVGEEYTKVHLYLSNGMVITRLVEKKKNGKNGYEVYDPKTGDVTYYNTKSVPLIQEYLGFSDLWIDDKKTIPLNFQKQGMSWFFIGDGFTNSDRAKIIGAVYQTHYVDAVIKDLEGKAKKAKIRMKDKQKDIQETEQEIEKYAHLPQLKEQIEDIEKRMKAFEEMEERFFQIKSLVEEKERLSAEIKKEESVVQTYAHLEQAEQRLKAIEQKTHTLVQVKEKDNQLNDYLLTIQKEIKTLSTYENLDEWVEQIKQLESKMKHFQDYKNKVEEAERLQNNLDTYTKGIRTAEQVIETFKDLPIAEDKLRNLEKSMQYIKQAKPLAEKLEDVTVKGKKERVSIQRLTNENEELVEKYQEILQQIGTCPMCESAVNQTIIEQISQSYHFEREKERV